MPDSFEVTGQGKKYAVALVARGDGTYAFATTPNTVDATDKTKVSNYAKATTAGDTAVLVTPAGRTMIAAGAGQAYQGISSGPAFLTDSADTARALGVTAYRYNGTSADAERGNLDATVLASAARTATIQSADQVNYNGMGVAVTIDVTVISGGQTITPSIEGKDPVSGKYYPILTGAAIAATTTIPVVLRVCRGITAAANLAVSDVLPRTWRVVLTMSNAVSCTASVGASVVV